MARKPASVSDLDLAPPLLLGVFAHRNALECTCVAPDCSELAVGFMTLLWRGVVAFPVCRIHAIAVREIERVAVPRDPVRDEPLEDIAPIRTLAIRSGSKAIRSLWTLWDSHCR